MAQSWAELLRVADSNSRSATEKLEEERRKRERLNQKIEKSRTVDQSAIQKILERRRREQEQKLAEEQRLKRANELKKQQKAVIQTKKQSQNKPNSSQQTPPSLPPPPPAAKPPVVTKKPKPNISYEDLMRYAQLKDNKQPIPKELAYVADALRVQKPSTSSSTSNKPSSSNASKQTIPNSKSAKTTTSNSKKYIPPTKVTKTNSTIKSTVQTKTKSNTSIPSSSSSSLSSLKSTKQPVKTSAINGQKPSVNGQKILQSSITNGSKALSQNRTSTGQKVPQSQTSNIQRSSLPNRPMNGQRPLPSNRMMNGQRPSVVPSRKRPVLEDSEDEEDDAEMRDFIVDDEDDTGFDYRQALQETLKKNFRFDPDRYRSRFLDDDDDDDLQNMESSFDQIQKEEYFSGQQGLREDLEDIMREEAEKKQRSIQMKKRPKSST